MQRYGLILIWCASVAVTLLAGAEAGRRGLAPTALLSGLIDGRNPRGPVVSDPLPLPVPCPADALVVITGGQSNAANALSDPVDEDPSKPVYMMQAGRCYPMRDPVLGATGQGGSLWTMLGHRLSDSLDGQPVVFINGAVSGSRYADWLNPGTGHLDRLRRESAAAAQAGLRARIVLWHQGESDAGRQDTDRPQFEQDIDAVLDALLAALPLDPEVRIVLYQVSACRLVSPEPNAALRSAQGTVSARRPEVILGPDTDAIDARGRYDGCHFNARGRDAVVDASLATILSLLPSAR